MPGRRCQQTAPVGGHLQERSDLHQGVITPFQVSRRAAPAITAWCLDQSGTHRVELQVPRRGQEMIFVHDERGEAALPQVPSPALTEVDPPRVPAMCLADDATQALGGLRDNDQVNMIGHQAICPDRDLLCAAESRDELEVVLVIFLTEERLLSAVSPLGDMAGHARSYRTCQSSHGGKLTRPQPRVKSYVWCPRNSQQAPTEMSETSYGTTTSGANACCKPLKGKPSAFRS